MSLPRHRFVYSRVQCRILATGERVNVGFVLGREKSFAYFSLHRPATLFTLLGVDPLTVHKFVTQVVEPRARALTGEPGLEVWAKDGRSLIQVDAPLPVLATDEKAAADSIRDVLGAPVAFR